MRRGLNTVRAAIVKRLVTDISAILSAMGGRRPALGASMDHLTWLGAIDQYYKQLTAKMRHVGESIRQNVEIQRKRDVVIVGAAAILALMAFGFFVIQAINAITIRPPPKGVGDVIFLGN